MTPKAQLFVWDGDFGLPSVEPLCCSLVSYVRMMNLKDTEVRRSNNPLFRCIPSVMVGRKKYTDPDQMLGKLGALGKEKLDSRAKTYRKYIIAKLEPALLLIMWSNLDNYKYLTRIWYKNAMPYLFFNGMLVDRRREKICNCLEAMAGRLPFEDFSQQVLKEADQCLHDMSILLRGDAYFFGSRHPTTLDAVVVGYLSVLLKTPLPSSLKDTAESLPNLKKYIAVATEAIFDDVTDDYKYVTKKTSDEDQVPVTQIVFAGLVATTAMALYGYLTGVFKITYEISK